jgi:hypothetical protein
MTSPLDGNAAAGALAEVLGRDLTTAVATCAACGDVRPVGALDAYMGGPGVVLRCRTCRAVQLRVVVGSGRAWLDLRGVRSLQLELT